MMVHRNEHTLASPCVVSGRGYWTGRHVHVTCSPAAQGTGIVLARADLPGEPTCPAKLEFADGVTFRTNLRRGEASFEMVEHLLAALRGLEIDNCLVTTDGSELPGLDGSASAWVDALQSAGLVIQAASRPPARIETPIRVETDGGWIAAEPITGDDPIFEYHLDYGDNAVIAPQSFRILLTPRQFTQHVATARTFVTRRQADELRAGGLAMHVTHQDLLVIDESGPVDNAFRFRDECARHKTLDLIGDLSLVGVQVIGRFTSHRGGHRLNAMLAREVSRQIQCTGTDRRRTLGSPLDSTDDSVDERSDQPDREAA